MQVFEGISLIGLTVLVHAIGAITLLSALEKYRPFWQRHTRLIVTVISFTWIVGLLVLLHLIEVGIWACFYHIKGYFDDFETAAYYSLLTYTTVGYGDVVLPKAWRIEGTAEALVGILMTGWSTALLMNVVRKFHDKIIEIAKGKNSILEVFSKGNPST